IGSHALAVFDDARAIAARHRVQRRLGVAEVALLAKGARDDGEGAAGPGRGHGAARDANGLGGIAVDRFFGGLEIGGDLRRHRLGLAALAQLAVTLGRRGPLRSRRGHRRARRCHRGTGWYRGGTGWYRGGTGWYRSGTARYHHRRRRV